MTGAAGNSATLYTPNGNVRVLRTLFFPQRIGRGSYLVRCAAFNLLVYSFLAVNSGPSREATAWIVCLLALVYGLFWVVLPRMRDLAIRPFWLILMFVPLLHVVFALILLFRPGRIDRMGLAGASEGQEPETGRLERMGG